MYSVALKYLHTREFKICRKITTISNSCITVGTLVLLASSRYRYLHKHNLGSGWAGTPNSCFLPDYVLSQSSAIPVRSLLKMALYFVSIPKIGDTR